MVETAGTKLRRMRILRHLSLEDAARITRISAGRLADLEGDDYSNFPNLAYAKSFLRSYAKFLNVDLRAYLADFEDASTFGLDDYQYLSDKPVGVYRVQRRPQRRKLRRSSLLMTASLVGILLAVTFAWFLYATYQRLGDLNKLADLQEQREHGGRRPGSPPPVADRGMQPTSATPSPASPSPDPTPTSGDSMGRELVALTLAESSPSAVLSQLSVPAADFPALPSAGETNALPGTLALRAMMQKPVLLGLVGNPLIDSTSAASGSFAKAGGPGQVPAGAAASRNNGIDGRNFYVHWFDKNSVDIFRTGVARPANPVRNNLE